MKILTERLKIFPLNFSLLSLYLANNKSFEAFLNIEPIEYQIHEDLIVPLKFINKKLIDDNENYWYQSLWIMIETHKNTMVGSLMLKGKLKKSKEIEIGYGTEPLFHNQGYMTEAISGIIKGFEEINFCKSIIAETLPENIASHLVLTKNGFVRIKNKKENFWWRKKIKH